MGYTIATTVIFIEFGLLAIIVLMTFIFKWYVNLYETNAKKCKVLITHYLTQLATTQKPFRQTDFKKSWRYLEYIYPSLIVIDNTYERTKWQDKRLELIKTIILPLARDYTKSRDWAKRFYASESFCLVAETKDSPLIIQLIEDDVPLVYLHAISAALYNNVTAAYNVIVKRMAVENRLAQSVYLQAFDDAPTNTRDYFHQILLQTDDADMRAVCYKILVKYPPVHIDWNIDADLKSENIELKLAAIKFYFYDKKDEAIPELIQLTKAKEWEVRLVSLHRLGRLNAKSAINEIAECLDDSDVWVRTTAAEILKNLGEEGEKLIKLKAPRLDLISIDYARHHANILW